MSEGKRTYRMALEAVNDTNCSVYPHLAGHADFALPYIGRLARTLANPQFSHPQSQEYFRVQIRDSADDYTFVTEFIKATQFYRANRSKWTDEEADNMGRAYRDMMPATAENVPF